MAATVQVPGTQPPGIPVPPGFAAQSPPSAGGQGNGSTGGMTESALAQPSLAPSLPAGLRRPFELTPPLARMPVELEVGVPVRNFRVRDLLRLAPGWVVESDWGHDADLPLMAGRVQLAWSEFEVVETQLAVRLTRLS